MGGTRERILLTALRLFARSGYEAVSVSDIALELGVTKGALYKHYKNKRDIFDSILARMERRDAERAEEYGVPEGTAEEMPEAYLGASADDLIDYAKAQLRYWTQDDFAAPFRRMLTLEQYRDAGMARLYQQYLAAGPLGYTADLLRGMGVAAPEREAAKVCAPMLLACALSDGAEDDAAALALADAMLEDERERLKSIVKGEWI